MDQSGLAKRIDSKHNMSLRYEVLPKELKAVLYTI